MNLVNRLTLVLLLAASCVLPCLAVAGSLWHAQSGADAAPELLTADEAFQLQPAERNTHGIQLGWYVSPGYYLYRERIHIEATSPANLKLPAAVLPAGEAHHDEHFGDVHIYRGGRYSVEIPGGKSLGKLKQLKVSYQGCAESGVCLPPQTRIVDILSLPAAVH